MNKLISETQPRSYDGSPSISPTMPKHTSLSGGGINKIAGPWPTKAVGVLLTSNDTQSTHNQVVLDKREYFKFKKMSEVYGGMSAYMRFLIRKELLK